MAVSYPFALSGINISTNWHWYCTYTVLVTACQVLTASEPSVTVPWINMHCSCDYTMSLCVYAHLGIEYFVFWGIKVWLQQLFSQKINKYVLSMIGAVLKNSEQHLIKLFFFLWNPTLARIWPEVDTFRMSLCEVSSGSPSLSDDSSPASAWRSGEVRDSWGSRT